MNYHVYKFSGIMIGAASGGGVVVVLAMLVLVIVIVCKRSVFENCILIVKQIQRVKIQIRWNMAEIRKTHLLYFYIE
jgi:hypothetical protein